jgi:hypothetical protein
MGPPYLPGALLQKEAIEAWRQGGSQIPRVFVMGDSKKGAVPFMFNLGEFANQ